MFENTITLGRSKEAKPCPFCGGTEIVINAYQHTAGVRYRIWCTNCLACIDPGWAQTKSTVEQIRIFFQKQ